MAFAIQMLRMRKAAAAVVDYIANGTFDTDTAWNKGTGWTISGGKANNDGRSGQLSQVATQTITPGTYRVTYTISSYAIGSIQSIMNGASVTGAERTGNGTYQDNLVVNSVTSQTVGFARGPSSSGFAGSIDDVTWVKIA